LFKYSWAALMINEFGGTVAGDDFLATFKLDTVLPWSNFVALALLFVGFRFFSLLGLALANKEKR
jgi:hypothetical protein